MKKILWQMLFGGGGPTVSGSLTEPIGTTDNIDVLFSELIDPATVTTAGDGTGSFEVFNNTAPGWVAGAVSTADNLTFSFDPTSNLTADSSYTVYLSSAIEGSTTGTPYNNQNFTFTAVSLVPRSSGNIKTDGCTSFIGWTDLDTGNGVSAVSGSTFTFTSTSFLGTNAAHRNNASYFTPDAMRNVYSYHVTCTDMIAEAVGGTANRISINVNTSKGTIALSFWSDAIYVTLAGDDITIPHTFPQGEEVWIDVDNDEATETFDIWIKDELVAAGVSSRLSVPGGTALILYVADRADNGTETLAIFSDILIGNSSV